MTGSPVLDSGWHYTFGYRCSANRGGKPDYDERFSMVPPSSPIFIRRKIVKGHVYLFLVKNVREGKRVRQIIIKSLGREKNT